MGGLIEVQRQVAGVTAEWFFPMSARFGRLREMAETPGGGDEHVSAHHAIDQVGQDIGDAFGQGFDGDLDPVADGGFRFEWDG